MSDAEVPQRPIFGWSFSLQEAVATARCAVPFWSQFCDTEHSLGCAVYLGGREAGWQSSNIFDFAFHPPPASFAPSYTIHLPCPRTAEAAEIGDGFQILCFAVPEDRVHESTSAEHVGDLLRPAARIHGASNFIRVGGRIPPALSSGRDIADCYRMLAPAERREFLAATRLALQAPPAAAPPSGGWSSHAAITYNQLDIEEAREVHRRLQEAGISCWRDETHIEPGQSIPQATKDQLLDARRILVCVGRHGIGPYQQWELDRIVMKARDRVIPVLLPGNPNKHVDGFEPLKAVNLNSDSDMDRLLEVLLRD